MKLSILTPSFNQDKFIEKTIISILEQNWSDVEHIVIDGGSTDHTIEILKSYPHLQWISEPDEGQADALNKGLEMASGDIIGWLNSDDHYESNIFKEVIGRFKDSSTMWVIGNLTHSFQPSGIELSIRSPKITYNRLIKDPDIVKQPPTFFRKSALLEVGGWDKEYYMTMDYDLWLKLAKKYVPEMVDRNWAYFIHHENQKSSTKNTIVQINNIKRILLKENAKKTIVYKIILKKYYYFAKFIIKQLLIKFKLLPPQLSTIPISTSKDWNKRDK